MKKLLVLLLLIFVFPLTFVSAQNEGDSRIFYIEPSYDKANREKTEAILCKETDKLFFYADVQWWEELSSPQRKRYEDKMEDLGEEFKEHIRPKMTDLFGTEPIHPVTTQNKISVLLHPMRENAGGYFNSGDQYSRYQNPHSNEMNLLYLNTRVLSYEDAGGFLGHEFMHLLVFNQKERLRGVREEIWLNEARAEFMPTFLGYNNDVGGNLTRRKEAFLQDPDISLTGWLGQSADYGVVNIFTHYLVDHYGIDILVESLKSKEVGIKSINYALEKLGYDKDFHQVFNEFKVAVLVNDCALGEQYCFHNQQLQDLKVTPATNYMPFSAESSLSVQYRTKNWAGNWHKITGGRGTLKLDFTTEEDIRVEIPYLLCKSNNQCEVYFTSTKDKLASIEIEKFNEVYESLIIMPSIQEKIAGFNGAEQSYVFTWEAQVIPQEEKEILEKLHRLRQLLEALQEKIISVEPVQESCIIEAPLYYGVYNPDSVKCLQLFLAQNAEIYPEGYVTGNFLDLTKKAVIRFQEKYAADILHPLDLQEGTGYVGVMTIAKINDLR